MSKTKPDHPIEEVVRMFTYDQSHFGRFANVD